ncbi:hypothetical protein C8P68_102872 [Mucilaginibacter yixingensis]|uniref:TIGR01777 family protein n=1 Tax=Mucilaginibacter yixingensis TaxID=1295612 RepID=A0A2T5JE44_9SPHI|nr:TIGR01777 family oxidoreductase [Mucilaginibacter yixingensis]PTR00041.1 hypothetical protein C8P68_102872 [Mucilaginibacter yixingensis]
MATKHILLTGGTGLLGKQLTQALLAKGHTVALLSRTAKQEPGVKTFLWDVEKGQIDEQCIDGVDLIIHLAGAPIAEKRWTDQRKQEIIKSRTESIRLIYNLMKRKPHRVKRVISASGISYYGNNGDTLLKENHPAANNFLGDCCVQWEQAVDEGLQQGLTTVKFRTGVVLTKQGGALPQLAMPIKFGFGSPLGSGLQYIPWIHQQDVTDMYLHAVEHENLSGVYNMVAPNPVTNAQLTKAVAKQLKRPLWAPKVPEFLIRLLFGEMAMVVLDSIRASPLKIEQTGFVFMFPTVEGALMEIY